MIVNINVSCICSTYAILITKYTFRGRKGIMADIFITLQETKYIILILDIMIQ